MRYPHIDYMVTVEERIEDGDARMGFRIITKRPANSALLNSSQIGCFTSKIEDNTRAEQQYFYKEQTFSF